MSLRYVASRIGTNRDEISMIELGHALSHCWDLPLLQKNKLTQLTGVTERALEENHGLELAKALRKELIACAEQISQRPRQPIEEIVSAIEKEKLNLGSQDLVRIQKLIGIRLPRNKIDLARYYAIRLVMEGVDQQTIAEFLDVDLRTVANYIAQAKERIWLILESKSVIMQPA
jgi:DNA-directed RNA polymerase specialized sigma24 family protein